MKTFWVKLFGVAALCHIILVAISIIEVFLYSVLVNPGQEESVYSDHATKSAPVVAIVFGVIVFYYCSRIFTKKRPEKRKLIAFALTFFYIIIDLIILVSVGVDWGDHYWLFVLSFGTKLLAALAGSYAVKFSDK